MALPRNISHKINPVGECHVIVKGIGVQKPMHITHLNNVGLGHIFIFCQKE